MSSNPEQQLGAIGLGAQQEEQVDEEDLEYETEPVLAYTRMKNDISEILQKDSASCIRSNHKVWP